MPYRTALVFAKTKLDWIHSQSVEEALFTSGQIIGKAHELRFMVSTKSTKPSSRITDSLVIITHPIKVSTRSAAVQDTAERAAIRALRQEASIALPGRLAQLAKVHDFVYEDVSIKQLKGRWGSCDQKQHIALNLFLMQLPWELIDYVLLHELVHTKHMHHGPDFWEALEEVQPGAKKLRSAIGKHKPVVMR